LNDSIRNDPSSGRVAAVAADPTDLNTVYIAAAAGGVWKTSDGGTTWTPLTDDQTTLFMGAITVAPSDPNTIYAGTGEADNSVDSYYGRGVLKSTDAGASWKLLGNSQFDRRTIAKIVVSPTDPNMVYVAVSAEGTHGTPASNPNTGIWRSTDGGATWTNTTTKISTTDDYSDLAMDPSNPKILFAAVGTNFGTPANGIYKTTNGGGSWSPAGNFPRGVDNGNTRLAIAPTNDMVLYASIADWFSGGIFKMMKSTDGGVTWKQLPKPPNYMGSQGWFDSTLAVDPSNPDIIYAGGAAGPSGTGAGSIIRSLDGGATWSDLSVGSDGHGPHVDHHGIGFDAAGRLLDGNDGGIWRLDNQTPVRWSDLNSNLQITEFIGIALDPTDPNVAYGGSQDNGTIKFTGSLSWKLSAGLGDGGFVRIDFNAPQTLYHTFYFGRPGFLERSDDGGISWVGKTNGINPLDNANFYPPYVMDPSNSSRLLLGTDRVYETTNRGDLWRSLSTPNANGWLSQNPIDSLAVAPSDVNTIYASAGGRIFVTTNHGAAWHQRNIPGVTDSFSDLLVDPADSQIAYAVRDQFNGGHVFRTTNGGVTWTNISGNLPGSSLPNLPAYTIAVAAGTLYVGNDDGVYFSTNVGATWNRLGDGLPHGQVHELVLNPTLGLLAAGTYGRGLWELTLGGTPTHFLVTPSANPVTAGSSFLLTVTTVDDLNNPVPGYSGTIHFSSSDSGATLPSDYTFTAADAGTHTFNVTLVTAGNQTITVVDAAAGISGTGNVAVTAGIPDHLLLIAPDTVTSGLAFNVTVTVQDAFNNTATSYLGTVQFTTTDSDPGVVLPADYAFTAGDAGVHTFTGGVTLITAGSQTLSVDDHSLGITGAVTVNVMLPAAPPGRRDHGSSGGLLPQWSGLLYSLITAPRPSPVLMPTAPPTADQALPMGSGATRINWLPSTRLSTERAVMLPNHRVSSPKTPDQPGILIPREGDPGAETSFGLGTD
jgi:photosystem II stability/assembly factor-like uncharacterized protein